MGKRFYKTMRRNYVVQVPAYKIGLRKDGSEYRIDNIHVPLSILGISNPSIALDLDEASRHEQVRQMVLDSIDDTGGGSLLSHSDEAWYVDTTGDFKISEETVAVNPQTGKGRLILML